MLDLTLKDLNWRGKKPRNEPSGMSLSLFSFQVFTLPTHSALSYRAGTLKSWEKVEDIYIWSLGVGLGIYNTDFQQKESSDGRESRTGEEVLIKMVALASEFTLSLFDMLVEFNLLKKIYSSGATGIWGVELAFHSLLQ